MTPRCGELGRLAERRARGIALISSRARRHRACTRPVPMNPVQTSLIGLSASSLLLLAACHRETAPDSTTTTTGAGQPAQTSIAPTTTPTTEPMTTPPSGGPGMGTGGTAAMAMSDSQLLQITHFANSGEIAQAKLAKDKSKNADVKKLAQMMLDQHMDADKKGDELAKKQSLTLADSATSQELKTTADSLTNDMAQKTGADFDKAYVDAQVKEHQSVLDILDSKLIPTAHDPDVKKYLQDVRKAVAMHLDHAKDLQAELAGAKKP